ncbi:MAG: hypothetical protein Sapg2KO_46750 [Saprospiraceae bacterium]
MLQVKFAGPALLIISSLLVIFHILVLSGIIPFDIVWAGKIKTYNDLVKLESTSLFILSLFITLIALKIKLIHFNLHPTIIKYGMWFYFTFFILNTVGNLSAKHPIEKYGFGFLTLLIALLIGFLMIGSQKKN